jgi:RNA polymerase sigma-70 factor (ECF subfamily)
MQQGATVTATITEDLGVALPAERSEATLDDLETVVRLHRGRIFRFLMLSLRDLDAAETLTQDCFLKAYAARHSFRGECSLETWLMRVAINLARDHARNRKLQFWRRASASSIDICDVTDQIANRQSTAEEALILREQIGLVWKAAEGLPARQREVFLLRFLEDKSVEEIATITGTAEKTVKSHLYRALSYIRAGCTRAQLGETK